MESDISTRFYSVGGTSLKDIVQNDPETIKKYQTIFMSMITYAVYDHIELNFSLCVQAPGDPIDAEFCS
jgi:hypothetical protein